MGSGLDDADYGYVRRVLISIDQHANVLAGGVPDETLSSRWGRAIRDATAAGRRPRWWVRWACAALNTLDTDHCKSSIEYDPAGNPITRARGRDEAK